MDDSPPKGQRPRSMGLELLAELRVAADAPDGKVAERRATFLDPVADVDDEVEIGIGAVARLDLLQQLHEPAGPFPAGRALATRLVHVELLRPQRELHHAGAVVDDDHRRGAQERAGGLHRVEVERDVELVGREDRDRGAAGDDRLQRPSFGDAVAVLEDQLAERRAERKLVVAGAIDTGKRVDDRAGGRLDTELLVAVDTQLDDRGTLASVWTLLISVGCM